ncbi:hypothetical protein ACHLED_002664 [Escherichia coli]|nr:hypothetical protein [Escherichia coli]EKE4728265.1 hypothetical protein [Escherichia coli]EKE5333728.1 hypothetical protein [Escherichia coli]HCE8742396.1 hypothetical protein [Escherichia coli]
MNIQELFGRQASVVSPFEYEQGLNLLFSSLGIFDKQSHSTNSILLTTAIESFMQIAQEKAPYAQSEWDSSKRGTFSNVMFEMKHLATINSVTSRDLEQYSRKNLSTADSMLLAINDFANQHYRSHENAVERDLLRAILTLKVESQFAGQGDIDLLEGDAKTVAPAIDFTSTTVNPYRALAKIVRQQSNILGESLAAKRSGVLVLAAGGAADGLRYNDMLKDQVVYSSNAQASAAVTKIVADNPAYDAFQLAQVTVIDVSDFPSIVAEIGENGLVVIPLFPADVGAYVLHTGVAVRHAEHGKDAETHHQYLTQDQFMFPSVCTETAYLPFIQKVVAKAIIFSEAQ